MSRLGRTFKAGRPSVGIFSPTNFWNRQLGPTDTVAADQSAAGYLSNMFFYGYQGARHTWYGYTGPGYGAYNWPAQAGFSLDATTFPMYVVDNKTPKVPVGMWQGSPARVMGTDYGNLQSFMNAVPIPDKSLCPAITGSGATVDIWSGDTSSERCCCIWNRDTDEYWEFFQLQNSDTSKQNLFSPPRIWTAGYGGYVASASNWNGVFPYQTSFSGAWGSDGCGLAGFGGLITMQDLRDVYAGGTIEHAIAFASGYNDGSHAPVPPATRRDGFMNLGNTTQFIPAGFPNAGAPNPAYHIDTSRESQRFRFAPGTTVADVGSFNQYPLAREMVRAIERYGMYNINTTSAMSFYFEDRRTQGSPYHLQGAKAVDAIHGLAWPNTWPWVIPAGLTVLNVMPWDALQLLDPVSG